MSAKLLFFIVCIFLFLLLVVFLFFSFLRKNAKVGKSNSKEEWVVIRLYVSWTWYTILQNLSKYSYELCHTVTGRFYKNPSLKKRKWFYHKKRPNKRWSEVYLTHDNISSHRWKDLKASALFTGTFLANSFLLSRLQKMISAEREKSGIAFDSSVY